MFAAALSLTGSLGTLLVNAAVWGAIALFAPNMRRADDHGPAPDPDRDLDPYEAAYIEFGPRRVADIAPHLEVEDVRTRLAADGLATGPGYPPRIVTRVLAGPVVVVGAVTCVIPIMAFPGPWAAVSVGVEVLGGGALFWGVGRVRLTAKGRARRRILRGRSRDHQPVLTPAAEHDRLPTGPPDV